MGATLISIIIYITIFLITITMSIVGEQKGYYRKRIARSCKYYIVLATIIPCFFAGMRGIDVGRDTHNYIKVFEMARYANSFNDIGVGIASFTNEIGLKFIFYTISRFTPNYFWAFAFYQLLTVVPLIKIVKKLKGDISLPLMMTVYLFCYYNNSFNLMRQSAAAAFIMYGSIIGVLYDKRESKKREIFHMLLMFLIAILLHKAAFIGVILVILVLCLTKSSLGKLWKLIYAVFGCLGIIFYIKIFDVLASLGLLNTVFIKYANIFVYKSIDEEYFLNPFSQYSLIDIFCRLLLVLTALYLLRRYKNTVASFLKNSIIYGFIIYSVVLFVLQTNYGQRISMFLDIFVILALPYGMRSKNKRILVSFVAFVYWAVWIMFEGWSGSRIYSFR